MGLGITSQSPSPSLVSGLHLRRISSRRPPLPQIRGRVSRRRQWLKPCGIVAFRLDTFTSRCSIANTGVDFNHLVTENEVLDDLQSVPSGCSIPIVHLKSDILENEPLKLPTDDTYISDPFTTLPVLSEQEQDALAAIPAHPAGLYALYATSLAGNLVEQLWNFAWPAAVALLHPSLLPVAVVGFFTKFAIFVGGPLVGNLMDLFPRVPAFNCLNFIQAAAQLLSAAMIIHALRSFPPPTASSVLLQPWFVVLVLAGAIERLAGLALGVAVERDWVVLREASVLLQPWFVVLVLAGAIERLAGLALGVAVERDWVVLLAGANKPIALAQANAVLSRIDLLCEIAGASLFGILLSRYDPVTCLKLAAGLMICTLPIVVFLVWLTNKLSTGVLDCYKLPPARDKSLSASSLPNAGNLVGKVMDAIKHGWIEYKQQPVLPASLAYVLLYFNVVLTPGGIMTAFLTQRGLNPSIIGGFSGSCAFMGVAATFISAGLVRRLGILKAGAAGLIFQASLLIVAVAVYWSGSLSQRTPLLFFLCLIVLSRLGHMSYDVVGAQILQTGIPTTKANLIATTEVSMASLAEFVMLGATIIANDASHFGFLALLSVSSVVAAAWMFCRWLANPTEEQRELFSFDSQF